MRYVIIDAQSTEQLEGAVNSMIDAGFEPTGGVYVDRYSYRDRNGDMEHEAVYFQAMFKPEYSENESNAS